jgi:hypothetical protein
MRRDRQLEQQGFSRLLPQIELTSVVEHHVMIPLEILLESPGASRAIGHHRQLGFDGSVERSQAAIAFESSHRPDRPDDGDLVAGAVNIEDALDLTRPFGLRQIEGPRFRPFLYPIPARVHRR